MLQTKVERWNIEICWRQSTNYWGFRFASIINEDIAITVQLIPWRPWTILRLWFWDTQRQTKRKECIWCVFMDGGEAAITYYCPVQVAIFLISYFCVRVAGSALGGRSQLHARRSMKYEIWNMATWTGRHICRICKGWLQVPAKSDRWGHFWSNWANSDSCGILVKFKDGSVKWTFFLTRTGKKLFRKNRNLSLSWVLTHLTTITFFRFELGQNSGKTFF